VTKFTDNRIPQTPCPKCGAKLDASGSFETAERPTAGDVSLCAYCGVVLIFADDLTQRPATLAEIEDIEKNSPEFTRVQVMLALDRQRRKAARN